MEALFVVFLVGSTAVLSVSLGVLGGYYAINAVLAAFNPARKSRVTAALVANQASGD